LSELKDPWHMPLNRINILQTLCYLLSTFLNYLDKHGGFGEDDIRFSSITANANNPSSTAKQIAPRFQSKLAENKSFFFLVSIFSDELVVYIVNEKKQHYLQKNPKNIRQCLIRVYIFCYVWSFGGGLKVEICRF